MNEFIALFANHPDLPYFLLQKQASLTSMSLVAEATMLATAYSNSDRPYFVIKKNLYQAQRLYSQILQFLPEEEVVFFGIDESLRVEAVAASPEMQATRNESMSALINSTRKLCITHTAAVARRLPLLSTYKERTLHLHTGMQCSMPEIKQLLFHAGFQFTSKVDQPMTFSMRGGIIDVFALNNEDPLRIEFFDREIESIRLFDVSTQRTKSIIKDCLIAPASELLFTEDDIACIEAESFKRLALIKGHIPKETYEMMEFHVEQDMEQLRNHLQSIHLYPYTAMLPKTAGILDYQKDPIVYISGIEEIYSSYQQLNEETIAYMHEMSEEGKCLPLFDLFHDVRNILPTYTNIAVHNFKEKVTDIDISLRPISFLANQFLTVMELLGSKARNQRIILCLGREQEQIQVRNYLQEQTSYSLQDCAQATKQDHGFFLATLDLEEGFEDLAQSLYVISSKELFQKRPRIARYANKFKEAEVLKNHQELHVNDFIVHEQYGVGQYCGIQTKEIDGVHKDFLQVVYRGNDTLLVPLEQFHLVRKFTSKEGHSVKTHKLGSSEWEKTKSRIKERVNELAERLVKLYALREEKIGFAYAKDHVLQTEFENSFEFDLTKDQAVAIAEIKKDMESSKPMDRLLCGDVGFGKTEVALRAAFKAVLDHKQVAFLCPTTILSRQHYVTFVKRLENYPVKVALLNRFVTPQQQKLIIEQVKRHEIDILIGTHRILSKDIHFADLGMLVIDEEQRFGVEHKEKIKEMKTSVDVLSLSATPIPRSLQMSLVGIRSLSQLDTPPKNRLPVQTYVIEKNKHVIYEIMERELARDGQVFYLYNRVEDIFRVASQISKHLPAARVGVAHGKMSREEIEDVMLRFTDNDFQILVCTTIIETGIDIPNANTIIIENADRFGLSQLYQIKGRVGRSDRLAYAYLLYQPQKVLSEIAMKRLQSIKEFTELGSGYKIAMRDLTIRGAGDMLGPEQAGFIDTVGIDMYIQMLQEAILIHQGKEVPQQEVCEHVKVAVDAYLPSNFVNEDLEKITLYQRIEKAKTMQSLQALLEEVNDRYGKLPKSVNLLFHKKCLDILVQCEHVERFSENKLGCEIVFSSGYSQTIDGVAFFEQINNISQSIKLKYLNKRIIVLVPKSALMIQQCITLIELTV